MMIVQQLNDIHAPPGEEVVEAKDIVAVSQQTFTEM
jgi:hypothetical protein